MPRLSDETPDDFAKRAVENTGLPLINAMGAQSAAQNELLNKAIRYQLQYVRDLAADYVGREDDEPQMPHEWGSLDSLDDMRNAMWVATQLMDELLWVATDKQQEYLRQVIADRGVCATDERVLELAWPGQIEDGTWMAELDKYNQAD